MSAVVSTTSPGASYGVVRLNRKIRESGRLVALTTDRLIGRQRGRKSEYGCRYRAT